ncbi:SURF1 family protein [Asticcacaulis sp.]|uniref:SURF1 family protein n=1 Tax=Asticcacaulis sp. TaxID=1872648 RepID=UPI002CD365ED|nr:SURF1 family protein [Asticcacaulis sp.]HTM81984.1 SURF1 family protein [Asticcacaulis sp.]
MSVRKILFGVLTVAAIAMFLALGIWQVQRLVWKTDLIARVNARVAAPPMAAPGVTEWGRVNTAADEYRHVTLRGRFLNDAEAQVYTLSDYGAGYWVMTPLRRDDGTVVYVNRGFVPMDKRAPATRPEAQPQEQVTVTGLLRMPEVKGWLLSQANDPARDAWYRRDIAAMAQSRHIGTVAPYFVDADATPNFGGWPKGGLTVVKFPNSHLAYALTWFSMAAMLAGVSVWLVWFRKPEDNDRT